MLEPAPEEFEALLKRRQALGQDPANRSVTWLVLHAGRYVEAEASSLLGVKSAELAAQINWPATD